MITNVFVKVEVDTVTLHNQYMLLRSIILLKFCQRVGDIYFKTKKKIYSIESSFLLK